MYVHLVARTLLGVALFGDAELAHDVWRRMRRQAPGVVAACLMPNHLHQIEATDDPRASRIRLARRLGAFARARGYARLWERLPEPTPIADLKHLRRQVRYVHLNPCRAGLVGDPLCWRWSTHRGAIGAELEPWVTPRRMARCLAFRGPGFTNWFHAYVSGDPNVRVAGTPLPVPVAPHEVAEIPLGAIIAAAGAATLDARTERHLAVLLAYDQGWRHAAQLARALGITPQAVRRLARRSDARLVRLGRLYLGDARLRVACRRISARKALG